MKVAIVSPGPIRSFSKVYNSWVENLIKPLEKQVGVGNVKIFIEYFTVDENHFENLKNMEFHTKLEVDQPGWSDILENSPYIEYKHKYHYDTKYINNIFKIINEKNNSNYQPENLKKFSEGLKKHNNSLYKRKKRMYYNLIHGICMNYNNKVLIDKIPDDYGFIVKIRSDALLLKPYNLPNLSIFEKNNTVFFQKRRVQNKPYIEFGLRWDTFFMGNHQSLKKMYQNFFKICYLLIIRYNNRDLIRRPEYLIGMLLKNSKLKKKPYDYFHDSHWTVKKSENMLNYG